MHPTQGKYTVKCGKMMLYIPWPDFDDSKLFSFILNFRLLTLIILASTKNKRLTVFMKVALLDEMTNIRYGFYLI